MDYFNSSLVMAYNIYAVSFRPTGAERPSSVICIAISQSLAQMLCLQLVFLPAPTI